MLVLARLCDDEGLFHAAGVAMARVSAGNPRRLLAMVFVIAAATTAILSLDATVVLLTPVVLATARTLAVPARPHAYATAHLANTASLLLPVSNLTNLLAFTAAGMSFAAFRRGHDAALARGHRRRIHGAALALRARTVRRSRAATMHRDRPRCRCSCWSCWRSRSSGSRSRHCSACRLRGPRWPARRCWACVRSRGGTPRVTESWPRSTFRSWRSCLCLGVVVDAVMVHGLDSAMREVLPTGNTLLALLGIAAVAAVLSNIVNNLPAVLVLLPLVAASGPAAVLAVLIGVNIGPNLTYVGSLANLLWRGVVRAGSEDRFRRVHPHRAVHRAGDPRGVGRRIVAGNQGVRRLIAVI